MIIPILVVLSTWSGGLDDVVLGVSLTAALFGCVLLHELGHALMARKFGIGTHDITLLPIGGVARLERMSEHPGEEIAIAVAGPMVNVVIATGLYFGMVLSGLGNLPFLPASELFSYTSLSEIFLVVLLKTNVSLVLFNLIPAFPMDGGRVFRALLSIGFGRLRGTEIAVSVAKVVAMVFILGGLLAFLPRVEITGQPILNRALAAIHTSPFVAVIGFFIMAAGNQERAMLRYQTHRRQYGEPPMVRAVDAPVHPVYPAQAGFSGHTWDPRVGAWIEWRNGQPVSATYVNGVGPS
jgi:Zn-dependent protease